MLVTDAIKYVFLDDGGVMNNDQLRAPQWQFFPSRLGGEPILWGEANQLALESAHQRFRERLNSWDETKAFSEAVRDYEIEWLRSMCAAVGVEAPTSDDDCSALARDAHNWIAPQVRAAFPGAADAVRELHSKYRLYTASAGPSYDLALHLHVTGIDGLFRRLYGPDLINWPKAGTRFYEKMFADSGVDPATALVVDDSVRCVTWARESGAQAVLINEHGRSTPGAPTIGNLSELLPLMRNPH